MELKKNNIHGSLMMYSNPYYYQYFTVEVLTGGSFAIYAPEPELPTVYYSLNNNSWTEWEYYVTEGQDAGLLKSLNLSTGDILRIKSEISDPIGISGYIFSSSSNTITYNVSGNIMSLVYGDAFVGNDNLNDTIISNDSTPFMGMFYGDTKIRSAINLCLPSFILSPYMYYNMFVSSALETAPTIIPARICENCYREMFANCEYLTGNIVIPEPIGINGSTGDAYYLMFTGSPNINVDCLALMNSEITPDALSSIGISKGRFILPWDGLTYSNDYGEFKAELKRFEDQSLTTSSSGITKIFKFSPDVLGETLSLTNEDVLLDELYTGGSSTSRPDTISVIEPLKYFKEQPLTFEAIDNCEFVWESFESGVWKGETRSYKSPDKLKYSINGGPWINYTGGVIVPRGSKISWMSSEPISIGIDETNSNAPLYTYFKINTNGDGADKDGNSCGRFNVSGNIMSLFSNSNASSPTSFEKLDTINGCIGNFQNPNDTDGDLPGIFNGCHIISASNLVLPAINLSDYCYAGMFQYSSLQVPPAILPVKNPRNVKGCYSYMFDGCVDLQSGPIIMIASTYDFSSTGGESGQKCSPGEDKAYLSGNTWTSVSNYVSYNSCSDMFNYMFQGTSIVTAPDIHVCFIPLYSGESVGLVGMFNNCMQLKLLNIYTHADYGYYTGGVYLSLFENMVTSRTEDDNDKEIIYPKIYCYDGLNDSEGNRIYDDLRLSAMTSDPGGFDSSNIVNLYDTVSIPEPDTIEYFYITVKDPLDTSKEIGTTKIAKKSSYQTWRSLSDTNYIDLKIDEADGSESIKRCSISYPYADSLSGRRLVVEIGNIYSVSNLGIFNGYIYDSYNNYDKVYPTDAIRTGSTYYIEPE